MIPFCLNTEHGGIFFFFYISNAIYPPVRYDALVWGDSASEHIAKPPIISLPLRTDRYRQMLKEKQSKHKIDFSPGSIEGFVVVGTSECTVTVTVHDGDLGLDTSFSL